MKGFTKGEHNRTLIVVESGYVQSRRSVFIYSSFSIVSQNVYLIINTKRQTF
jgi:hypothetical protein